MSRFNRRACAFGGGRRGLRKQGGQGGEAPLTLPASGLHAHWEARAAQNTLDANGEIVTLADLSGRGEALSVVGALGSRPGMVVDADFGGQTVAVPDGTAGECWQRAAWTGGPLSQPTTHYWVGEWIDPVDYLFDCGDPAGVDRHYSFTNNTNFNVGTSSGLNYAAPAASTPFVLCVRTAGAVSQVYVDDFVSPAASGSTGAQDIDGYTVCARLNAAQPLNGKWAMSAIYSTAHDAAARAAVAAYIAASYGLSITV